ncbi:MAG: hypothetical protein M1272_04775 [Firmicutes bacterium]|nr:hypothetical protein [Bacillota bacterium]
MARKTKAWLLLASAVLATVTMAFPPVVRAGVSRALLSAIALGALVRGGLDIRAAWTDRSVLKAAHPHALSYLRLVSFGGDTYIAAVGLTALLRFAIALKLLLGHPFSLQLPAGYVLYWVAPWFVNTVVRVLGSVVAALAYVPLAATPVDRAVVAQHGFSAVYALSIPEWQNQLETWADALRKIPDPDLVERMMVRVVEEWFDDIP